MNLVPISRTKHRDKALSKDRNYLFTEFTTLAPVCLQELPTLVTYTPLVFYQTNDVIEMVAILGLDGRNYFVRSDGSWPFGYVPAAFRCHPFSAVDLENGGSAIVYREDCGLIVDRSDGDPFFNTDGSEGEVFKNLAALAVFYKRNRAIIRKACSLLSEFELLTPLTTKKADGEMVHLENVYGVDRAKFNNLGGRKFSKLRESNAIEMIYAHFFSQNCFHVLFSLKNTQKKLDQIESNLSGLGQQIFADKEEKIDFNF